MLSGRRRRAAAASACVALCYLPACLRPTRQTGVLLVATMSSDLPRCVLCGFKNTAPHTLLTAALAASIARGCGVAPSPGDTAHLQCLWCLGTRPVSLR